MKSTLAATALAALAAYDAAARVFCRDSNGYTIQVANAAAAAADAALAALLVTPIAALSAEDLDFIQSHRSEILALQGTPAHVAAIQRFRAAEKAAHDADYARRIANRAAIAKAKIARLTLERSLEIVFLNALPDHR